MSATDESTLTSPSVNWSSFLSQVKRDYETPPAQGIARGLQKDAIQNGWGARVNDRGIGWSFDFALLKDTDGRPHLTMTDAGATGLIGRVYTDAKDLPPTLVATEKLARFEAMFDSGGGIGPGLFGRGKLLFNAASRQQLIYYDSKTLEDSYRLGKRHIIGRNCNQLKRVLEGDEALRQLGTWTGGLLQPLSNPGTRITIVDPIQEIVDAIHDGSFLKAIEETWWEIIQKFGARITVTTDKGDRLVAQVPKEFGSLPKRNADGWQVYYKDNEPVEIGQDTLRIKHLHFLLPPPEHILREELLGVNVYRRGMKIGPLQLTGVPDEITDRFFGYVQLVPEFEEFIAETENTTHYGFASRNKPAFRSLKKVVQDHFDVFMQELGYKKSIGDPDEKAKKMLEEAGADLDSILSGMGVPGFGAGRGQELGIQISLEGLTLPGDTNYVTDRAEIAGFWYSIRNTTSKATSVWVEVFTHERDAGRIETILARGEMGTGAGKKVDTAKLSFTISERRYPRGKKIGCTARVTDKEGKRIAQKTFFLYFEMIPEPPEHLANITLTSADWPRPNSRRVDYGQSIRNLAYEVENNTPLTMRQRIRVRTLWAEEKEPIDQIAEQEVELSPFGTFAFEVNQVTMTRVKYEEVGRGKIIIRCHSVAKEQTSKWEKGTRLAEHNLTVYLNMDPSYGFFEDRVFFDGGSNQPRSEAQPLEGSHGSRLWTLRINKTHPAFLAAQEDDDRQKNYLFEEMARQTIYVLLRRDQFDPIRKLADIHLADDVSEMEPEDILQTVAYRVTDRIVAEYYRS